MSSDPQSCLRASSILVPPVFLVLRKMNLCSCEMITAFPRYSSLKLIIPMFSGGKFTPVVWLANMSG
jgi:hypothetical protein